MKIVPYVISDLTAVGAQYMQNWKQAGMVLLSHIYVRWQKHLDDLNQIGRKNTADTSELQGSLCCVESDLDLSQVKFKDELIDFAVDGPGEDNVTLRHHFEIPDLRDVDLGEELYRKVPWAISRKGNTWFYLGINPMRRIRQN